MLRSKVAFSAILIGLPCLGQYAWAADPDYYPAGALRKGEEGATVVKVCVANGKISSVTLVTSSGHKELDEAAVENMRSKLLQDHLLAHPPVGNPATWCKDMKITYSTHPKPPDGAQAP